VHEEGGLGQGAVLARRSWVMPVQRAIPRI
jgi:hypothetical protein